MNTPSNSKAPSPNTQHHRRRNRATAVPAASIASLAASLMLLASSPARAVDGCVVLLCLAAPSWRAVPQCVPPIRQLFRDLAKGKVFPTCGMSGSPNAASHDWSSAPAFCPPQYTRTWDGPNGPIYTCDYNGAVSVTVNGELFARTWWSMAGDAVTDFSPSAKAQLGGWDKRFDTEYAAWLASAPSTPADATR